jgi:hypothetical protein
VQEFDQRDIKPEAFRFSTKAKTLESLGGLLSSCSIPACVYFTVEEWENDSEAIISRVRLRFKNKVVVRSSCQNEDSYTQSMAGRFKSILDVEAQSDALTAAITEVIATYVEKNGDCNPADQVLIQEQITDAQMSGVIFTQDIETGAPYYIVNYDDFSGRTDIITSGTDGSQKIFTYCKIFNQQPSDPFLRKVLDMARELEQVTGHDRLDIEFVIANNELFLLQARPLVAFRDKKPFSVQEFKETVDAVKTFLRENNTQFPNIAGSSMAYGIMPDWNPAEIIGTEPKPLAFSLYQYLITDNVWPLGRQLVGYKDVGHQPGICSLAGMPYVDIRMSFNTFLPQGLSREVEEKLVNFYIGKLRRYQDLHDKVEFKVVFTCYNFDFAAIEEELRENDFYENEIVEIKQALHKLTENILAEQVTSINAEMQHTQLLTRRRENVKTANIPLLTKVSQLGHDCKMHGTLPFVKLARFAFIGSSLMRSLLKKNIITQAEYDDFFGSIKTVATEFLSALGDLKAGEITRQEFLQRYGHLRPGTYEICSKTYAECFDEYIDLERFVEPLEPKISTLRAEVIDKIDAELHHHDFALSSQQLLSFIRKAVMAREKAKFEFTKNLSLMLEYLEQYFGQHGISREDISFLHINDVIEIANGSLWHNSIDILKQKISRNKEQYAMTKLVKLPPVIFMEKSAEYFRSTDTVPNFVTQNVICADVIALSPNSQEFDLKGKIVAIENADPGYDWIFSHDIAGLITEFGGANSHMTIRAAEFKLPAAIGCGSTLYNFIKSCKKIELNCATKQIKPVL